MALTKDFTEMEIQTTIKDLPKKIQRFKVDPDTPIRVSFKVDCAGKEKIENSDLDFVDGEVWEEGENMDISSNIDLYLYDETNPHGQ